MAHLNVDRESLETLCRHFGIRRLSLYGSAARGAERPDSDLDLLVEFEVGKEPGLIRLAKIELELSRLLGGRKVDLRTANDLSRYFRDEVVASAEVQFDTR
jgi:uncharacterized protein